MMLNGNAEGLVLVSPATGGIDGKFFISKWKIGAEKSSDGIDIIKNLIKLVEEDTDGKIFQDNKDKAQDLFKKLLDIQQSELVNGKKKEIKKAQKVKELKNDQNNLNDISEQQIIDYDNAIKSAKTKFDHADTYFLKGGKGFEE